MLPNVYNYRISFGNVGGGSIVARYDSDADYSYCGTAEPGSGESDEVWTVTRISILDLSTSVASDIAWDDHLTATYV